MRVDLDVDVDVDIDVGVGGRSLSLIKYKVILFIHTPLWVFAVVMFFRYQEDGIQDSTVAREMFLLRRLQEPHWYKELHSARTGNLLCRLLRG